MIWVLSVFLIGAWLFLTIIVGNQSVQVHSLLVLALLLLLVRTFQGKRPIT